MKDTFEKMKKEMKENRRQYLENCKNNYTEYIMAAQKLFPEYYKNINDLGFKYNQISQDLKAKGDVAGEKAILEEAISKNVDTPYTYNRLAVIYSKEKEYRKAYEVCKKWFVSIYWKIPNMASTTLKILDRMEKLKKKLNL